MPYNPMINPRENDPGYDAKNKADAAAEAKKRAEAKAAEQASIRAQKEALLRDRFGHVMSIKEAEALEEEKIGAEAAALRRRMREINTAGAEVGAFDDEVAAARKKAELAARLKRSGDSADQRAA